MRVFLLIAIFYLTACAEAPLRQGHGVSLSTCTQPPKDGWPVFSDHFYDREIHLVPNFSKSPSGYKTPDFMTGYTVVFVKPATKYANMGLNFGDEIVSIDDHELDMPNPEAAAPAVLSKIKNHEFKKMRIRRCLEIR